MKSDPFLFLFGVNLTMMASGWDDQYGSTLKSN